MSAQTRNKLLRAGLLLGIGLVTQPVIWALVQSYAARVPLVAAAIPAVEAAVFALAKLVQPTQVTSEPAATTEAPPGGDVGAKTT